MTQPFGLAVFLLVAGVGVGLVLALATGRSVVPVLTPPLLATLGTALMLLLLGSWAYKLATV